MLNNNLYLKVDLPSVGTRNIDDIRSWVHGEIILVFSDYGWTFRNRLSGSVAFRRIYIRLEKILTLPEDNSTSPTNRSGNIAMNIASR